jgi:hypothetical protein
MAELVKELGIEVAKVKAQSKAPLQFLLGPGPDSKVTSIGMTVGCLKAFPESASEVQSLLKDLAVYVAFKMGKNFVENRGNYDEDDDEDDEDGYYASRPYRKTQEPFLEFGYQFHGGNGYTVYSFRWSYSWFYNTIGYYKKRDYNDYNDYYNVSGFELVLGPTYRWTGKALGFGLFGGLGASIYSYESRRYVYDYYGGYSYDYSYGSDADPVFELGMEVILGYVSLYLSERNFDRFGLGIGLTFWRDKE